MNSRFVCHRCRTSAGIDTCPPFEIVACFMSDTLTHATALSSMSTSSTHGRTARDRPGIKAVMVWSSPAGFPRVIRRSHRPQGREQRVEPVGAFLPERLVAGQPFGRVAEWLCLEVAEPSGGSAGPRDEPGDRPRGRPGPDLRPDRRPGRLFARCPVGRVRRRGREAARGDETSAHRTRGASGRSRSCAARSRGRAAGWRAVSAPRRPCHR